MQSDWNKLEIVRVVDAGFLLAGLEPQRKWQFAPPLVKNFYELIKTITGAVTGGTLPGERTTLTQVELQELIANYGVKPKIAPTEKPILSDSEALDEREFVAAFSESVNNGSPINWRYWVHQLPVLTAGEAARLMCGLDPDQFKSLESRPNKNDPTKLCQKAEMIQRLAERESKVSATPNEWLAWAGGHQIAVHDGFRREVDSLCAINPQPQQKQEIANEWATDAQNRALEIIKEMKASDLYPSQVNMADQIAREFRNAGRVGVDGKPLSGAYIKRHALNGITSAVDKQLSTSKRQSK